MTDHALIARQINCAVIMLSSSMQDVERGRYSDDEIRQLGDNLAHIADELRGVGESPVIVVESQRTSAL